MYNSDTIIRKLIQQLKSYYNSETEGVTVIIGAGCSLRSSSDDISTEGIVKDIVKKHLNEDQDLPDTWKELYSLFVNNVWTGQGEQDRIDLLAPYFKNLEPSKGYLAIRNLIKTGYIKNIITTNFDPLIDEILKDIPHRTFIDGLKKESFSDDNFSINFVKAHGDLQHGNIRFAPDELRRLSPEIEAVIHSLTKGMFSKMQSLFILFQQILLFQKTTCEKKDIISTSHRIKLILENYCKEIKYSSTSTKIFFENMTPQDDSVLEGYFRNIMKAQTRELVGKSRTYYIKPDIYIYYEVDLENNRLTSLYDEFYNRANTLTEEFLSAVQFNNFILPDTVEILKRFMVSDNPGLIITGVSGSGKTTALAHWIKNLQASDEYLILPFSGKNQLTKNGLQSFSDWLSEPLKLQEINELFCCRKKTLLLVYDAINEIPNTFDFLQNIYNQLICFVEKLSTHKYNNIKMILSLRKDVYMQLNDNHAMEPREGIFFPTILPNREISLTYEISPFSKDQAVKFLMDSTNQSQEVITTLYNEFSGILQMPIYIKLFADAFTSFSNFNENNFGELISRWYKILLQKISENNTHQDELVVIINEIILSKYQYIDENVSIKNIAKRLNLEEKIIIKDVNLFAEAGILTYKKVTKEINFSHDVYEQIFLTQYLMKIEYPEDFCCNILEKQINMHILSLALKDYLLFQKELNQEYYFEILIKFISKNHSLLNNCIIENALLLNENSSIENHWSILFQKIDYNIGLNCHKYILQLILHILNTRIDKHNFFSNSTLNELRPLVIQPTYIMNSQKDQAFFEFINAKYWYTFSYKFENDVLKDAQIYCINAKKLLLSSDSNISLCDDINFLYAILLRYEGKLIEAVNTLQKVLQNQIKFSVPDKICKTALELGAIYRELTKFDDALGLYKSIKKLYRDFPPYWDTRLQLNMGIIYKNKQQVKSVNHKLTKDDFNDFKITQYLIIHKIRRIKICAY